MHDFEHRLQDVLGNAYQVERELPLGGLGRLFLATEVASGRQVAVQALPPDLAGRLDTGRLRAAVDRVARLKHPGVIPLIAAGAKDDIVYCVWPHPHGESLRDRLVRDGGLASDEAQQVLHDVADALAHGHAQGVCHGDLRPDTIYLAGSRATIAEFGVRSALNAALGAEGGMDERADLHALAVAGQQMLAGRGGPVAEVVARALSIDPAEQYPSAAALRDALGAPPSARRRRRRAQLAALGVLALLGGLVMWQHLRGRPPLIKNLIAVAPFEILDPEHAVWREGMVTVLSANLDGAGPLHAVSPTMVVRRWEGAADAASAAALGRATGASLVLFGRVVRAGGDTMRLTASLLDVQLGTSVAELQLADPDSRLDRLADSLTMRVLRELGRSRPIAAVSRTSLGASSLPALRAFLEGEQHFRRSEWDSALAGYQRAIELDSTFALALYRAGVAVGWVRNASDSLSNAYLERAAAHNHGLPQRDSMLLVAESLSAALADESEPDFWRHYRRLYATTAEAAHRYPHDPEVWYEYGDVRYHNDAFSNEREMREAFDRAITLDSAFAPAFLHPIELALGAGDAVAARRYISLYLDLHSSDVYADAVRLTRRLLDPRLARAPETEAILDTASVDLLLATQSSFRGWADTLDTWVRIATLLVDGPPHRPRPPAEAAAYANNMRTALAYRGRLREAWRRTGERTPWLFAAMAWVGGTDPDSTMRILAASLRSDAISPRAPAVLASPLWAERGDAAALATLERRADSTARAARRPDERAFAHGIVEATRALEALVRGDTTAAVRGLEAMPDTVCLRCVVHKLELARLLDARHMDADAAQLLAHDSPGFVQPTDAFWELYRARLAVRRGDRAAALRAYRFVRDVWRHADDNLQPYVREAREYTAGTSERD